jgi:hypothetical protein
MLRLATSSRVCVQLVRAPLPALHRGVVRRLSTSAGPEAVVRRVNNPSVPSPRPASAPSMVDPNAPMLLFSSSNKVCRPCYRVIAVYCCRGIAAHLSLSVGH